MPAVKPPSLKKVDPTVRMSGTIMNNVKNSRPGANNTYKYRFFMNAISRF